jgi:hypothetical protein
MSSVQRRLAAVSGAAANLIAQLDELNELRERVRKAQLLVRRPRRTNQQKSADLARVDGSWPARGPFGMGRGHLQ